MGKLKYERINNSENVISIDLHNGYSIIAVSGWFSAEHCYKTSLYLKENTIDTWSLIEKAECIKFNADYKTINSAILKKVATYLDEGFFDYYINRYEYETSCFYVVNDLVEKERILHVSQK